MKLTAADLHVIHDTLYHSLKVSNWYGMWTSEARQQVAEHVMKILETIEIDVIAKETN